MSRDFVFSSRSVSEGHPDKLCDQVSDALVGLVLRQDPCSRVSVECAVSNGILFLAARFASTATMDLVSAAREVIRDVGYVQGPFTARACTIMTTILELPAEQRLASSEEDLGEDDLDQVTVRDHTTVFGYACTQTPALMPLPIWLAHKLARRLDHLRRAGALPYLAPEAKTLVSVQFHDGVPSRIFGIGLVCSQTAADTPDPGAIRADLIEYAIRPVFEDEPIAPDETTLIDVNAEGPFVTGGPAVHAGLTGRKIAVDAYGEFGRSGTMALSGKDPGRIGRVGMYAARHAAKNVVAAGLASQCEVQLTYTPGHSGPVSVQVETFGTGRLPDRVITARVQRHCDFRLAGIVKRFRLRSLATRSPDGFYRKLACYGQVGRIDLDLPWEVLDLLDALRD
jgi:S-adenosylmethionine synthetase